MIIVVIAEGKGRGDVDFTTIKLFNDVESAEKFINQNTDMESKYWKGARIVGDGEQIEMYYNDFL
jgi:hypothetical protein